MLPPSSSKGSPSILPTPLGSGGGLGKHSGKSQASAEWLEVTSRGHTGPSSRDGRDFKAKSGREVKRSKAESWMEFQVPFFSPFSLVPTSTLKERGTREHAYSVYRLRNSRVNYELAAQICADAHVDDILVQFPNGTIRFCIDVQLRYRRGRKEDLSRITHHLDPNFNFLSCGMKKSMLKMACQTG